MSKRDYFASVFRVLFNYGLLTLLLAAVQVSLFAVGILSLPVIIGASTVIWILGALHLSKYFIPVDRFSTPVA